MQTTKSLHGGFSLLIVLVISAALAMAAISLLLVKKTIDEQNNITLAKYDQLRAEDIVRTNLLLSIANVGSNSDLVQNIKNLIGAFKVNLSPQSCKGTHCYFEIVSTVFSPNESVPQSVSLTLALNGSAKVKLAPVVIVISQLDGFVRAPASQVSDKNLVCSDIEKPIFAGVKYESGRIIANCKAIDLSPSSVKKTNTAGETLLEIACSSEQGQWLLNVDKNLRPVCETFPKGISEQTEVRLCPPGSYAKSYQLNSKLEPTDVRCVPLKGAYEF